MFKKMLGRFLCAVTRHDRGMTDRGRGIPGGWCCVRDGCNYKVDPIKWPNPPSRPKKIYND